jgi:hypothetical protein
MLLLWILHSVERIDFVEWELAGEIEVLGENLIQYNFAYDKSHTTWAWTRDSGVGSRWITALITMQSFILVSGIAEISANVDNMFRFSISAIIYMRCRTFVSIFSFLSQQ